MSAVAFSPSAIILEISSAEDISVSCVLIPSFCRSFQVPTQLAQVSGIPTELTAPSFCAAFKSASVSAADAAKETVIVAAARAAVKVVNLFKTRLLKQTGRPENSVSRLMRLSEFSGCFRKSFHVYVHPTLFRDFFTALLHSGDKSRCLHIAQYVKILRKFLLGSLAARQVVKAGFHGNRH